MQKLTLIYLLERSFAGRDMMVYSYYFHSYNNNAGNLNNLFANGLCWKLKGSRKVLWVSKEIKEHAYEKSVKIQYYDKGRKIIAHTHPKNIH
jgi:hypothetical protein